jgi:Mce-associated membrane protein
MTAAPARDLLEGTLRYPRGVLIGSETSKAAAETDEAPDEIEDLGAGPRPGPEDAYPLVDNEARRPSGRPRRWAFVALGAVVVAIIVVELVLLLSSRSQVSHLRSLDGAQASALVAARQYATEVASYDYRQLDHDFSLVESNSTPAFRTQFQNSSGALKPVLTQYRAVAKARVVAAGLESASASRAVAAVFIDQTVSNTTQKSGATTDQSRLELTLVRQHGKWLIENLKLL